MATDPVYSEEIVPLAVDLIGPVEGRLLDLGCGEGQVLRASVATWKAGCDLTPALLEEARDSGAMVQARLPSVGWLKDASIDAAVCVLVMEHLGPDGSLFIEVARVLAPGGRFVLVMNHPAYTADGAGPVVDVNDGEVLWRWGRYFDTGAGSEPAGPGFVTFHHRPLSAVLNEAADAGLTLERVEERSVSPKAVARDPGLIGQEHMPRLLAARWRRIPPSVT